ncbi:chromosomal replication initiator protein DnaA [Candidatus Roizmanbacteria bacterium]|nr:chromosomal replication initiator protein DnaA [Candidatus Roizmanbacteria bacterium]
MAVPFWAGFLKYLENNQKKTPILYSLLKQLKAVGVNNRQLTLACNNHGMQFFLNKKVAEVQAALKDYLHQSFTVEFVVVPPDKKKNDPETTTPLLSFQPSAQDVFLRAGLNNKYRFDNFAVSSSNQVGFAAAQAIADNPGTAYNPLVLHGGVGVGKTHLAQAIARAILEKDQTKRVFFCPGDQFTNELIEGIREKSTARFRKKYRHLQLLIVDDVQFIAGKQTVQEEFFHTFNSVLSAGGQIVLISDRPPAEIKNLEDRLRSRFSGGLIVDIQDPSFELRTAILLIKAKEKAIGVDIEAAKVIAEEIKDTRALEGTLLSIYAKVLGSKDRVDLEAVDSFFSQKEALVVKKIAPSDIVKAVCTFYNVKQAQVRGPSRIDSLALPRQIAMYLLRRDLKIKLTEIAFLLKRKDHTTVIHAEEKIARLMMSNPVFREEVEKIRSMLGLST